jgi:hypothetical protein
MSAVTPEQCDAIYRTDVYAFAQATAAELEPATKFEPTWHHEAIATVLEDSVGNRTRAFINAPQAAEHPVETGLLIDADG